MLKISLLSLLCALVTTLYLRQAGSSPVSSNNPLVAAYAIAMDDNVYCACVHCVKKNATAPDQVKPVDKRTVRRHTARHGTHEGADRKFYSLREQLPQIPTPQQQASGSSQDTAPENPNTPPDDPVIGSPLGYDLVTDEFSVLTGTYILHYWLSN
jgi:hypothetical protein